MLDNLPFKWTKSDNGHFSQSLLTVFIQSQKMLEVLELHSGELIRVSRLLTPTRKRLLAFRDFLTLMRLLWFDFENSTAKFERRVLHRCQSRTWGPFFKQKTDRGNLAFWKSCMSSLPRLSYIKHLEIHQFRPTQVYL